MTLPTSVFPNVTSAVTSGTIPTNTFSINPLTNSINGMVDGQNAMVQAISIALNIDRYRWPIYTSDIGSELDTLPGNDASYIMSEIQRMVPEALSVDDRVLGVSNYTFAVNGDSILVTFTVSTIYGDVNQSVQVNQ
jgi:hypothetical protein